MDPIVSAAGAAVVSTMATDASQQTHNTVVAWWRRVRPDQAEAVDVALGETRAQILAARQAHDISGERTLVAGWQARLQSLLSAEPSLVGELRRLLDEELTPALPAGEPSRVEATAMETKAPGRGAVHMAGRDLNIFSLPAGGEGTHIQAQASDQATVYQAGRDQYLRERHQHIHYEDGPRSARAAESVLNAVQHAPYPGLWPFNAEQAQWFFGREELISDLLLGLDGRLRDGGALAVIAPSGAGKSSLLRAGLLPAIARGMLPAHGSGDWPQAVFTPTAHPLMALAAHVARVTETSPQEAAEVLADGPAACVAMLREALARQAGGRDGTHRRWIVLIDQLEELFTLCYSEQERTGFLSLLHGIAEAGPGEEGPAGLVVYGLRSDFYTQCINYPQLVAVLQDRPVVVGPMSQAGVREAIMLPASNVGLEIEPGLVEILLRDLGAPAAHDDADGSPGGAAGTGGYEAGRLPLLAHALRATWQQRHGYTLTVEGYRATGGIARAVGTTAEEYFHHLDPPDQQVARTLFLRLVKIGTGAEDTRQPAPYTDLLGHYGDSDSAARIIETFTQARLLTRQDENVEITHEVLLRAWPRLREWIDADRAGHLIRQEIEEAAIGWERAGRDTGMLYRGSRLEAARPWADQVGGEDLSPSAAAFLTASLRQQHRAPKLLMFPALVLLMVTLLTTGLLLLMRALPAAHGWWSLGSFLVLWVVLAAGGLLTARRGGRTGLDTQPEPQDRVPASQSRSSAFLDGLLSLLPYRSALEAATPALRAPVRQAIAEPSREQSRRNVEEALRKKYAFLGAPPEEFTAWPDLAHGDQSRDFESGER